MSVDPVDGEPRYSYGHNKPTLGADPSGREFLGFNSIDEFVQTVRFLPSAAKEVYIDPGVRAWNAVKRASKKFQNKVEQVYSHSVGVVRSIYHKLENFFHQADAAYNSARSKLPPVLHNLAPPPIWKLENHVKYQLGLTWGAIKGLFGMIPFVGAIPDLVDFLQYFFSHVAQEGFFKAIGSYFVEQWNGLKALFTQKKDIDPFARGEIAGSILVSLVVTVVGIILTAGAALPLLLHGGVQNFFKNAKSLAKAGVQAAKASGKANVKSASDAIKAVSNGKLPPGMQKHLNNLNKLKAEGKLKPEDIQKRVRVELEGTLARVGGVHSRSIKVIGMEHDSPFSAIQHEFYDIVAKDPRARKAFRDVQNSETLEIICDWSSKPTSNGYPDRGQYKLNTIRIYMQNAATDTNPREAACEAVGTFVHEAYHAKMGHNSANITQDDDIMASIAQVTFLKGR
jgi:hypothetical protein